MAKKLQTVLIVDDSPISRKMLKSCFPKEREFQFHEAGDGLQALNLYRELKPDLVTLDLTMPVMDGFTALAEIRAFDPEAMVIVCTADVQDKSLQEVTDKGAFMILAKPPSKGSVLEALTRVEESA
ncbi:response regulator [Geomonas sp. Red32]|uniref:response regulator n=1 Tax=Geomonas sp. Red32 TaxID=2912856 RepID=UPI00202CFA2C|nr:response regulator [Geomonas sp. Red32]MCM0083503.1 response regulator [Geomonas sp. Red32]